MNNPEQSAINSRRALEWITRAIYLVKGYEIKEHASLFELVDGEPFKEFVGNNDLMKAVHYIRKVDNASAHTGKVSKKESFFALMKNELLYVNRFDSMDDFKRQLADYIDYYNNKRIKLKLKMSPVQYRT
ncbi:MAG: IS3 family transposase, partial [Bacteroidales bacterium]|nr:IS3 family transposase [Bacteroidales bacterium]